MKEFTLKKDSWHYKLATYADSDAKMQLKYGVDLCEYVRMVMKSFFIWGFMFVFASLFVFATLYSWYDLVMVLFFGKEMFDNASVSMLSLQAALIFFGAFIAWRVYLRTCEDADNPSFVTLAYRKFKDKTCSLVKFE